MFRVVSWVESFRCAGMSTFATARWKLCASKTFEILPISTCTLCQEKSYISKSIQPLFEIFASASKMLRVVIWVESFRCAGSLLLQLARRNLCASKTFEILPLSTCTLCQKKSYISNGIQSPFVIFASARRCLGWSFGLKVSAAKVCLLLQWQGEKFSHRKHLKFCRLSTCTLCQRKSYISKSIQPLFEVFASARRCLEWSFVWKVSGAQIVYFCNGKAKTLRMENIWNFATFNLYTVAEKNLYASRGIQPLFEIFAWDGRCWGWSIVWKVSSAQVFYFCNGKVKTFAASTTFEILPLSTCTLWQRKILRLQRYSTDFRNLRLSSKMLRVASWVESFRCAGVLLLQWQGEKSAHRKHLKFCRFQLVHCGSKKSYISKGIQTIFEILASARRCVGWAFAWKVSCAQVFYFCNGNVKTLRIDKIWNSSAFNLFTVLAKIPYLQRYSIDFRNLCLSSKMLRVGIWMESFRCAGILFLQCEGENFAHGEHLKFCQFQPVHCARINPISPKVFNRYSKSLPQLENV